MSHKKTVCFDLDGTLAVYDGWKDDGSIGNPIETGVLLLKKFWEEGWIVLIQSCRTNSQFTQAGEQYSMIWRWLQEHNIPFNEIVMEGKAVADIYYCDRTITFRKNKAWQTLFADGVSLYQRLVGPENK